MHNKILITLFFPIIFFAYAQSIFAAPTGDNIIITEVEFDPSAAENEAEWFELYNPTTQPIDIGGWSVAEGSGPPPQSFTFPSPTVIPSGGYLLVVNDPTGFAVEHPGIVPDIDMEGPNCYGAGPVYPECLRLNNSGIDELTLRDGSVATGTVIDYVSWGAGAYADANNGESICRNTSSDTDTASDWLDSCTPSPGSGSYTLSNDLPIFTPSVQNIPENTILTYDVSADASDPNAGQMLTYDIVGAAADSAFFTIDATTGILTMTITPDFENPQDADSDNTYEVDVRVTDDGTPILSVTATVFITITDVNAAPTDLTLSNLTVTENAPMGTVIGTLNGTDDGENNPSTLNYMLGCGGSDDIFFSIAGTTLTTLVSFDYENPYDVGADNMYDICVQVSDGTLTYDRFFTIVVTDAPENAEVPDNTDNTDDTDNSDDAFVLHKPTNLTVSCKDHHIRISWTEDAQHETGFIVARKKGDGSYKERKVLAGENVTTYKDKKVDAGWRYAYKVRAYRDTTTGRIYGPYSSSDHCTMDEDVIATPRTSISPIVGTAFSAFPTSPNTVSSGLSDVSPAHGDDVVVADMSEQDVAKDSAHKQEPNKTISDDESQTPARGRFFSLLTQKTLAIASGIAFLGGMVALFSQPLSPSNPFVRLASMLGFLFYRKRSTWGTVYDEKTRLPIVGARVTLFDQDGAVIERMTTDAYGRYGFLAGEGTYTIAAEKVGYRQMTGISQDVLYGDIYDGTPFTITKDAVLSINIALTPQNTHTNHHQLKSLFYVIGRGLIKLSFVFVIVGFLFSLVAFVYDKTLINGVMILLYVLVFIVASYAFLRRPGMVRYGATGKPAPFALIALYKPDQPQTRVYFAVSDEHGRYMLFVANGTYIMKVSSHGSLDTALTVTKTIHVRHGLVRETIDL